MIENQKIPVMEQFYSIQGEGYYAGRAAYFIRLGGCDVGCVWCDVKDSWDKDIHPELTIQSIIDGVKKYSPNFVVITGGEPAMYDLTALTTTLSAMNIEIAIETSGVYPVIGTIDWVCFSPKKFKSPTEEIYAMADELKIIVFNQSDLKWAESHAEKVRKDCKLYLQPEWSKAAENTKLIVEYVKDHPQWNISLQTHKYIDVP